MVLIWVFVTHVVSGFWVFEAVNGVLTEYGHHPYKNGVLILSSIPRSWNKPNHNF